MQKQAHDVAHICVSSYRPILTSERSKIRRVYIVARERFQIVTANTYCPCYRSTMGNCYDASGILSCFPFHVLQHGLVSLLILQRSKSDYIDLNFTIPWQPFRNVSFNTQSVLYMKFSLALTSVIKCHLIPCILC